MSTDDTNSDEVEIYTTRRRFQQAVGGAAIPASHAASWWDRLLNRDEDHAGVGEDLVIQQNGEVVERDINTLNFEGSAIKEITKPNDYDDNVIRITLEGGSGSGGAFEDTDGDGIAELQDNHVDFQGGDARNLGSVGTNELNKVHVVPSDASDWGAAVNNILSSASESVPVIYTPPGTYSHSTTATPSKPVVFVADGAEKGQSAGSPTVLDRGSTDTEFIMPDTGTELYVEGYQFQGDDTGTSDAVYNRGYTLAKWCDGINLGTGNVFHIDPGANDENINGSQFEHVGGRQVERVVYTQSGTNCNDIKAHIELAFNCNVAAYEQEGGSSHEVYVGQFEGSSSPTAAVVLNASRNKAYVRRVESSAPAVEFNAGTNYAEVLYNVTGEDFRFNNSNNRAVNIASDASFYNYLGNYQWDSPFHHDTGSGYQRLVQSRINGSEHGNLSTQRTTGVSTSAKTILSFTDQGGIAVVSGRDESSATTQFTDIVSYNRGGGTTTIASHGRNTPASRTYGESSGDLTLTMGSGSYTTSVVNLLGVPITP